jgi:polyketide biosynthesis acyl carrier protein
MLSLEPPTLADASSIAESKANIKNSMSKDEVFETLRAIILEVEPDLSGTTITHADSMRQLGVPSVSRVEILMMTQEALGIKVPNSEMASAKNLGEVVEIFARSLNA